MNIFDNSLLSTLLSLAASFLGLSIVVQVIQELYKYLRSSKGRAFQKALNDFLGPLSYELQRPGVMPDVRVRGPFQLKRVRPKGTILPLSRDELVNALERTAPGYVQLALSRLKFEVEYQSGAPKPPSALWLGFLNELGKVEQGTMGYWNAFEIASFLREWNYSWEQEQINDTSGILRIGNIMPPAKDLDANLLMSAFRKKFLGHVENAGERYSQFESNFNYTYGRANRRLSFIISLIITICFNLQIDTLYKRASAMDPADAVKLADSAMELYNQKTALPDSLIKENLELAGKVISQTLQNESNRQATEYLIDFSNIPNPFKGDYNFFLYLLYSLITAVFITFGAPFWNDIASALLHLQKSTAVNNKSTAKEENNG